MNKRTTSPSGSTAEGSAPERSPFDGRSDVELVAMAAAGDGDAFGELFERHREGLYLRAFSFVGQREDALDMVQDAFVRAWERLRSFRGESSFATWMGRIVSHLCIDRLRRPKVISGGLDEKTVGAADGDDPSPGPGPSPYPSPVRAAQMAEFAPALRRALMRLSEKHRAVFLLHAQEGLRYREIAEKLGVSMGTVMSRLFYAREKLQEMLASHLPDHAVIADGADGTKALERERSAS